MERHETQKQMERESQHREAHTHWTLKDQLLRPQCNTKKLKESQYHLQLIFLFANPVLYWIILSQFVDMIQEEV